MNQKLAFFWLSDLEKSQDLYEEGTKVIFIRHAQGQHQNLFMKLIYFLNILKNPPLSRKGLSECKQFKYQWLFENFRVSIYVSPFLRCVQTIKNIVDQSFVLEPLAREISASSEDKYECELDPFPWADSDFFRYETPQHQHYRAYLLLEKIVNKHPKGITVVICHKLFMKGVLRYLEIPLKVKIENLEGFYVRLKEGFVLKRMQKPNRVLYIRFFRLFFKLFLYCFIAAIFAFCLHALFKIKSI